MRRPSMIAALAAVAIGIGVAPSMGATPQDTHRPASQATGDYIVVLKDSADSPTAVANSVNGIELHSVYRSALHGFSATLTTTTATALRKNPMVAYVERDGRGRADGQYLGKGVQRVMATKNTRLKIGDGVDQRVDADVAVLDTGIDQHHPDLNVVHRVNCSGVPKCVDDAGTDDNGHGSNVAGIAGELDNKTGYAGVAPGARLWSVKTLDKEGTGSNTELVAGLDWVTAHADEIEVANISAGYDGGTRAITDAVNRAIAKGVVVVVSAGNDKRDVENQSPANIPDAITVSALSDADGKPGSKGTYGWCNKENKNTDDSLWINYSKPGEGSNFGHGVDIAAPGDCIQSTSKDGGYSNYSGTSQAAPHVAGAAAWLATAHKPKNRADVLAIREKLREAGNSDWTDTSEDGVKEPLLDLGDTAVFTGRGLGPMATVSFDAACEYTSTTCSYDATGADPDGVSYTWDFGDGKRAGGLKATHSYPDKEAKYITTLTVREKNGRVIKGRAAVECTKTYSITCHAL
ncbi:S8 family serine peptidase [Streptomyces cucumeris]|uniref:S8 family serine peptidase n=1 Tax=Streptomyces cucumeris TaxID=2962890 RepID=UPI003D70DA75